MATHQRGILERTRIDGGAPFGRPGRGVLMQTWMWVSAAAVLLIAIGAVSWPLIRRQIRHVRLGRELRAFGRGRNGRRR